MSRLSPTLDTTEHKRKVVAKAKESFVDAPIGPEKVFNRPSQPACFCVENFCLVMRTWD